MGIRVVLADDHTMMLEGLRSLLEKQSDVEVVGEARDGRTAVQLAGKLTPDVVIMDVAMPGLNGIEATRQIMERNPDTKVLALSMHSDRQFVTEMLAVGASGYLLKDDAFDELVSAPQAVVEDRLYLGAEITDVILRDYVRSLSTNEHTRPAGLTPREREVVQLLSEGLSTSEIACRLHVSEKTVHTHRQKVMDKLDIHTIAELTKYAVRRGLTALET